MRVGVLYSGGKDSTYAAYYAKAQGHDLGCLITVLPESEESYIFHYPNADKTCLQAEAMGLPLLTLRASGVKGEELGDLSRALKMARERLGIEGIFTGHIIQMSMWGFEGVCRQAGLEFYAPLWQREPEAYLNELINLGFAVIITSVSALGLDANWLGRRLNEGCIEDLRMLKERYGVNMAFEGGEGETFVTDCPIFTKRVDVLEARKVWKGNHSGRYEIVRAGLAEKGSGHGNGRAS